jgi:hypothetical protein
MRHFLASGAVASLARGVVQPSAPAVLIAAAGRLPGGVPGAVRARPRAITIAPIAAPTQKEDLPAVRAGADHKPERVHAPPRPAHRGGQSRAAMRRRGAESRAPQCVIRPEGPGCADSGPSPFRSSRGTLYVKSRGSATPLPSRTAGSDSRAFSRPPTSGFRPEGSRGCDPSWSSQSSAPSNDYGERPAALSRPARPYCYAVESQTLASLEDLIRSRQ